MSEHLYFIFGLPPFEIELKNRKLMVNHKAVMFKGENYSFHLGVIGLYCGGYPKIRNPESGIQNPISGIRNPESGIRYPESDIRNPISGIRNPESDIRNPESGIRNPQIQENKLFKFAKIILYSFCLQKNKRPSKNPSNVTFFETTTSHLLKFVQLLFW